MHVEIVEVGPRDGLQNEKALLSPEDKAELIRRSAAAGLRRVESVSFVSSKAVPQMAAAEEVMARTERVPGVSYSGLVLNPRGLTRAIETGMDEVNVVLVASETLSQRNQGATIGQMVGRWRQIVAEANGAVPLSVAIAAAFGCPFEGEVDPELVARLAGEAYDGGAVEMRSPWTTRSESAYRPRSATWRSGYARPPPASAARALPQHPEHRLRQRFRRGRGRDRSARCQHWWIRRLPVRPERHRQHRHRGPRLRLPSLRHRHRCRHGDGLRNGDLAERAPGQGSPALLGRAGFFRPEDSRQTPVISRAGVPA